MNKKAPQSPDESFDDANLARRLASWTRYLVMLPVLGLFVGATTLFVMASIDSYHVVAMVAAGEAGEKQVVLDFIELADIYLLATDLYIISVGLFELFIDDSLPLPDWLEIHTLDDLKEKLVGVVIVVLAVTFLGQAIKGAAPQELAYLGGGIAAVIAALAFFIKKAPGGYTKAE